MIYEDPDELGYWCGPMRDFKRDIENMRLPEFFPPGYSMRVCNELLPAREQHVIEHVVELVDAGHLFEAERERARAGYDSTSQVADRLHRGLPGGAL